MAVFNWLVRFRLLNLFLQQQIIWFLNPKIPKIETPNASQYPQGATYPDKF
jgi:hypothetical protein